MGLDVQGAVEMVDRTWHSKSRRDGQTRKVLCNIYNQKEKQMEEQETKGNHPNKKS